MKRVLLTGADGYIGQHVIGELAALGYEVHAVSRQQRDDSLATWHQLDLFDTSATTSLIEKLSPTHLMHLAWITEPGEYWRSPQNEKWRKASVDLLTVFAQNGGKHAVLAGTCAEYDLRDGHCVAGKTPIVANTPYTVSKLAFREAAFALADEHDLHVAWARVFFSFGPHERRERLVPDIIVPLLAGNTAACTDGGQIRDFMYVQDIAAAMTAVLDSGVSGDINIASGNTMTLRDLVRRIAARMKSQDRVEFGKLARRADEPPRITADVSGLQSIGWTPKFGLDAAIDETIAWWRESILPATDQPE